jgi:hypothetical protein
MRSWVVMSVLVVGSAVACARGAKEASVQEARPVASAEIRILLTPPRARPASMAAPASSVCTCTE